MSAQLTPKPNLEQLRKQAKDLLSSVRSGDDQDVSRLISIHPKFNASNKGEIEGVSLADAQLVIAREHSFSSWPKLKSHIERLQRVDRDTGLLQKAFDKGDPKALRRVREAKEPEFVKSRQSSVPMMRV